MFAVSVTVPQADQRPQPQRHPRRRSTAEGRDLTVELPTERAETYLWLLTGRRSPKAPLLATRELVTKAIPPAEAALHTEDGLLSAGPQAQLNDFFSDLGRIGSIRHAVDAGTLSPAAAFQAYSNVIDAQFHSYDASDQDNKGGSLAGISVGGIRGGLRGRDGQPGGHPGRRRAGRPRPDERRRPSAVRQRASPAGALYLNEASALLTPSLDAGFAAIVHSPNYQQFQAMESQIMDSTGNGPLPVNAGAWEATSGAVLAAMQTAEVQ